MHVGRIPSLTVLLFALLPSAAAVAGPVALSESGEGSALIAPLWSVREGHDTLISIRNNGGLATAVKLRVIEADGVEVLSLNLYLGAQDTWVAALTDSGSDGLPDGRLITADETCILPLPARDESRVARLELPALAHGNGYLEITEMGVSTFTGPAGSIGSFWDRCETLSDRFETGTWASDPAETVGPPGGRLSALVHLINVGVGGMVSPSVTALSGFSDVVQHSAPGSEVPDLSTAVTSNTASGLTESRVCGVDDCDVRAWNLPVEAVASVLLADRLEASYSAKPSIGAVTQFVYTRPLARFESDADGGFAIDGDVRFAERSRDADESTPGDCPPQPTIFPLHPGSDICGTRYFRDRWILAVAALQFGQVEGAEPGFSLLGTTQPLRFDSLPGPFVSGELQLHVDQDLGDEDRVLTSADGAQFPGDAIIGFAVQQFSNGTLVNPDGQSVRATYRSEQELIRVRISEPVAAGAEE